MRRARKGRGPRMGELNELIIAPESAPHLANRLYVLHRQLNSINESAGPSESGSVAQLKALLQDEIDDVMSDDDIIILEQHLNEMNDGALDVEAKRIASEALEGYHVFSESVGVDEALRRLLERLDQAAEARQWAWQLETRQQSQKPAIATSKSKRTKEKSPALWNNGRRWCRTP